MGGVDARCFAIGEFAEIHQSVISQLSRQKEISPEQALQHMYNLNVQPARTHHGQGGRHDADILQDVSKMNPFFYIIDGFRYGFLGASDGSIKFGLIYLLILSFLTWFVAYILFKKGYKIKS